MDYDFKYNTLTRQYYVQFSMGHEAVGRWLVDELANNHVLITQMLERFHSVIQLGGEWQWVGKEFHLSVTQEEVMITAHCFTDEDDVDISEEHLFLYQEESIAVCGTDDLVQVLEAWRDFVHLYG